MILMENFFFFYRSCLLFVCRQRQQYIGAKNEVATIRYKAKVFGRECASQRELYIAGYSGFEKIIFISSSVLLAE